MGTSVSNWTGPYSTLGIEIAKDEGKFNKSSEFNIMYSLGFCCKFETL